MPARGGRWYGSTWCERSRRLALYARGGFACVYCGASVEDGATLTLDHVVPDSLGGDRSDANLVVACLPCNSRRRDLTLRAFLRMLRARGVSTVGVALRVRRQRLARVDRALGRRILGERRRRPRPAGSP